MSTKEYFNCSSCFIETFTVLTAIVGVPGELYPREYGRAFVLLKCEYHRAFVLLKCEYHRAFVLLKCEYYRA